MKQVDREWKRVVANILENGVWQKPEHVRAKWDDGTPAPTIFVVGERMKFDGTENLAPNSKHLYTRKSLWEMWWIWIAKSNIIADLHDKNVDIWDKWEIKEEGEWQGTIGPAYGYQLASKLRPFPADKMRWDKVKPGQIYKVVDGVVMLDQVDHLIQSLLSNPGSRRLMTTLWSVEEIDSMGLPPCVYETRWIYNDGKLDLIVKVRSNDIAVGNPFNTFQYDVLHRFICQTVEIPKGDIMFDLDDAHIYDRHIEEAKRQLEDDTEYEGEVELWINPEIDNFYMFDMEKDVKLINYKDRPKRKYEVAE
jgi:thymidylate synthase